MTDEWIAQHESRRRKLHVYDPWSDKLANKAGLPSIYICSTMTEIMRLTAEKDAEVSLGTSNPEYEKYIALHNAMMKCKGARDKARQKGSATEEQAALLEAYTKLCQFIETYQGSPLTPVSWDIYMPDIRVLDTIDECVSWLHRYLEL